jgi:hypothetical protein
MQHLEILDGRAKLAHRGQVPVVRLALWPPVAVGTLLPSLCASLSTHQCVLARRPPVESVYSRKEAVAGCHPPNPAVRLFSPSGHSLLPLRLIHLSDSEHL